METGRQYLITLSYAELAIVDRAKTLLNTSESDIIEWSFRLGLPRLQRTVGETVDLDEGTEEVEETEEAEDYEEYEGNETPEDILTALKLFLVRAAFRERLTDMELGLLANDARVDLALLIEIRDRLNPQRHRR